MTQTADVLVVGAGVVGAAIARELARAGRRVRVLERGAHGGEAWRAAAGMLAPQVEAHADDPLFEFAVQARRRYEDLAPELLEATGIDIGLWFGGIARVAADETDAQVLRHRVAWQRQAGHRADWLDAEEVVERWPHLGATTGALWAPNEGALDPARLVEALLADARRHGAEVVVDDIRHVERTGERIVGVRGRQRHLAADVILAAGAWSPRLTGLARPIAVEPIRGQMLALPWPPGVPRCIVYRHDSYVVHRGGEAIVGSTMEPAGFEAEVTEAGREHLRRVAALAIPALAEAPVARAWAGLRPLTPDGIPIVGPEPRCAGLWYATGHGRNGVLLAGATGVLLRDLLDGAEPTLDGFEVMRPDRFWQW